MNENPNSYNNMVLNNITTFEFKDVFWHKLLNRDLME